MHPAFLVHVMGQRVAIGGFQLGLLAPFQNFCRQGIALFGEFLKRRGRRRPLAGGGLLAAGQSHLAEQDFPRSGAGSRPRRSSPASSWISSPFFFEPA